MYIRNFENINNQRDSHWLEKNDIDFKYNPTANNGAIHKLFNRSYKVRRAPPPPGGAAGPGAPKAPEPPKGTEPPKATDPPKGTEPPKAKDPKAPDAKTTIETKPQVAAPAQTENKVQNQPQVQNQSQVQNQPQVQNNEIKQNTNNVNSNQQVNTNNISSTIKPTSPSDTTNNSISNGKNNSNINIPIEGIQNVDNQDKSIETSIKNGNVSIHGNYSQIGDLDDGRGSFFTSVLVIIGVFAFFILSVGIYVHRKKISTKEFESKNEEETLGFINAYKNDNGETIILENKHLKNVTSTLNVSASQPPKNTYKYLHNHSFHIKSPLSDPNNVITNDEIDGTNNRITKNITIPEKAASSVIETDIDHYYASTDTEIDVYDDLARLLDKKNYK